MIPGLELLRGLRGRNRDRGHRPLHRLRDPGLPSLAQGRQLGRAEGVEPRQALQVDRSPFDRLGRVDHDHLRDPAVQDRPPVGGRLRLAVHQLHDPLVRGHRPHLRRLVGPLREELVQGPGQHGHRGRARALRGGVRGGRERPRRAEARAPSARRTASTSSAGASSSARASRSGACVPGIATQRIPAAFAAATPASVSSKTVTFSGRDRRRAARARAGSLGIRLPALDVLDRDHDATASARPAASRAGTTSSRCAPETTATGTRSAA